jgi:hypothetical protein
VVDRTRRLARGGGVLRRAFRTKADSESPVVSSRRLTAFRSSSLTRQVSTKVRFRFSVPRRAARLKSSFALPIPL